MMFSVGLDLDPVKIRALASHPIEKNAVIVDDWMKLPSKTQWVTDQLCHSKQHLFESQKKKNTIL